jgi:hypothetical protein
VLKGPATLVVFAVQQPAVSEANAMSAAVVNYLHFKEPVRPELFSTAERDLASQMKAIDGFKGFHAVQVAANQLILLILGEQLKPSIGSRPTSVLRG